MPLLLSTWGHPHMLRDAHTAPNAQHHGHCCSSTASGTASWTPAQSPCASQLSPANGLLTCTSRRQLCTGLAYLPALLVPVPPAAAALLDEDIATDVLAQTGEPAEVSARLTPADTAADTAVSSQVCGFTGGRRHFHSYGRLLGPQICCCQLTLPGQSHAHECRQPGPSQT